MRFANTPYRPIRRLTWSHPCVSIIVSDANSGARRLYRRCGYREIAKRPMVKEEWENPGEDWLLLVKSL
jgi:ribosomal protein S18 acetylase RimI-like enzyme